MSRLHEASIHINGPFRFYIDRPGASTLALVLDGGEWRLDGLWIAQGRVNRFEALARALRRLDKETT